MLPPIAQPRQLTPLAMPVPLLSTLLVPQWTLPLPTPLLLRLMPLLLRPTPLPLRLTALPPSNPGTLFWNGRGPRERPPFFLACAHATLWACRIRPGN